MVGGRYRAIAPCLWLDTQPALLPYIPEPLPAEALPYLQLVSHHLHLPGLYGFFPRGESKSDILLLDNIPVDVQGQLLASIVSVWGKVPPHRQLYWLWQILDLWTPLCEAGVASSLLATDNIRVEGWRIRLRELQADPMMASQPAEPITPSLSALTECWQPLAESCHADIAPAVQSLCQAMQEDSAPTLEELKSKLNQSLLEQVARLPLQLHIAGGTTAGPKRHHNEDAGYPLTTTAYPHDPLVPNLAIICDGIGGHAGGEVASQMAVRTLQLQLLALLTEITEQPELTPPEVVQQQLEAIVRVVNNVIAEQNNTQGREARQRMGTTLVMALQLPQAIASEPGTGNSHELYLVNIGDSRAYWLTPRYCHQLTQDDDVATREVRLGRQLYRDALRRPDAGSLVQALGTRDGDMIRPTVQRFIVEEDGLLLLCSDGLSDGDRVEQHWQEPTRLVFKGRLSLDNAVQSWLDLADNLNGHDNTTVVIMQCQVSPGDLQLFDPELDLDNDADEDGLPSTASDPETELSEDLVDSARALLYDEPPAERPVAEPDSVPLTESSPVSDLQEDEEPIPARLNLWALIVGVATLMFLVGAVGIAFWRQVNPTGFQNTIDRLFTPAEQAPDADSTNNSP
jgi:protein phosphatase